jgi:cytochrome c biogenesis protein CcdA
METVFAKAEEFTDHIKDYINTRIDLIKLQLAEKTSKIIAGFIAGITVAIIFLMFFLFVNISIAYLLGEWIGRIWAGFLIVSGLYLFLGIFIWTARNKLIRIPIMNKLIEVLFNNDKEDEEDQKYKTSQN